MSTIEKLTIQGVRSFGPNSDDVQNITFTTPVTLILGKNGCGKTTIIECLKYALIAELPPGGAGKNFVHDPKIFHLADCLGQIKLLVRNIKGDRLSICRSMKLSNRGDKQVFETLESAMNYIGTDNAATVSISKRSTDVKTEMCQFIGVSEAIISNVLFCHQEDSSWPLDEPKKLKEKFDKIFGIEDYNKAIEKIIKLRKELTVDLKVKETELPLKIHLKEELEKKTLILEGVSLKQQGLLEDNDKIKKELTSIESRLDQIHQIEISIEKNYAQQVELETNEKNVSKQIKDLSKKIKKLFEGTRSELEDKISFFNEKILEQKNECANLEEKLHSSEEEKLQMQNTFSQLDKKVCILKQQFETVKQLNSKKLFKLNQLCEELKLELVQTNDDTSKIEDDIKSALAIEESKINEIRNTSESEENQKQKQLDETRVSMAKIEESIDLLEKQKKKQQLEILECENKIKAVNKSSERSSELSANITKIEKHLQEANFEARQEETLQNMAEAKTLISNKQTEFKSLDETLALLNSYSNIVTKISLQKSLIEKKEAEISRLRNKHSDNLKKFAIGTGDSYRRQLQEVYEKLRRDNSEKNKKLNALHLSKQSYEIKRRQLKEEINRCEKELEEAKEKVFDVCHSIPYDNLIIKSKEVIAKCQLEYGALTSSENIYKKYIENIKEDTHCPLCHKNLSKNETLDLKTELLDEIHHLPDKIKQTGKMLEHEQAKFEQLLQLKPTIDRIAELESLIPKSKTEFQNMQSKLSDCIDEEESLELLLTESNIDLEAVNAMFGDLTLIDESIKTVTRANEDIKELKMKIPQNVDTKLSVDDLQNKKQKISSELDAERERLGKLQQNYEKTMEANNKLIQLRNSLRDEHLKAKESLQNLPQLQELKTKLVKTSSMASNELIELNERLLMLTANLKQIEVEKSTLKEENKKRIVELQRRFQSLQNVRNDIKTLNEELASYKRFNITSEMARLTEEIKNIKADLSQTTEGINKTRKVLEHLKQECTDELILERDLKDNLELKILEQKQAEIKENLIKMGQEIKDFNVLRQTNEKKKLYKEKDANIVRSGEILGKIGEIQNQISKLKAEIEEPKLKDSVFNYKKTLYEVELIRLTLADLAQYRVSIEWALLQFHSEKMAKINSFVREYWRLIYKGNDIDYIEIQFNEDETKIMSEQRRNYNYRVIQSKNNTQIEMRGRCSAGQRVLASLIIRMALAETFSNNCGVLALDEPTTNLDRNNIISLCDALNRIVEQRSMQNNFMLLIITHDEEFISALGKIECYYHVFRDDQCKSQIRKVKIN